MARSTIYGQMFPAWILEEAVIDTVETWFDDFARAFETEWELTANTIQAPAAYANRNSFDYQAGEILPRVVAISPGLVGTPFKNGQGLYTGTWSLGLGAAIGAPDEPTANRLNKSYSAILRAIIEGKSSLGIGASTQFIGETYQNLPVKTPNQLVKSSAVFFLVTIEDIVKKFAGPESPDPGGSGEWPNDVETISIDLRKEPIT